MDSYNYNRFDVPLFDSDNQTIKDCKKTTPDFKNADSKKGMPQVGFKAKNAVVVKGKSLVNKIDMNGVYMFDSYDKYDNTCYVSNKMGITYNVLLTNIKFVNDDMKKYW